MKIADYLLLKALDKNSRAIVYLAKSPRYSKPLVVKLLSKELAATPAIHSAFLESAQNATEARHLHLNRVRDFGEFKGAPFVVMDYVPGDSLEDKIRTTGLLDNLYLLKQVAHALEYLNEFDRFHGNLHPRNVLLHENASRVLVTDYGFNHSCAYRKLHPADPYTNYVSAYLSPGQLRQYQADPSSDVYSLGMILYTMLVGKPLINTDSREQILEDLKHTPQLELKPNQQVFEQTILRALDCHSPARFRTVADFEAALSSISDEDILRAGDPGEQADSENAANRAGEGTTPAPEPSDSPTPPATIVSLQPAKQSAAQARESGQELARILSDRDRQKKDQNPGQNSEHSKSREPVKVAPIRSSAAEPAGRKSAALPAERKAARGNIRRLKQSSRVGPGAASNNARSPFIDGRESEFEPERPSRLPKFAVLATLILANVYVWGWNGLGPQLAGSEMVREFTRGPTWSHIHAQAQSFVEVAKGTLERLFKADHQAGTPERETIDKNSDGISVIDTDTGNSQLVQEPVEPLIPPESRVLLDQAAALLDQNEPTAANLEAARKIYRELADDAVTETVAREGLKSVRQAYLSIAQKLESRGELETALEMAMLSNDNQTPPGPVVTRLEEKIKEKQLQARIQSLLERGEYQLKQDSVLYPGNDNAVLTFREVLNLNPENQVAREALSEIKRRAIMEVEHQMARGQLTGADALITRLEVFFDESDEEIQQLAKKLEQLRNSKEPKITSNLNQA